MTATLIHYMAPIMFVSLVVFLLLGYPVAFSLAANGLIFGLIGASLAFLALGAAIAHAWGDLLLRWYLQTLGLA